MLMPASSPVPAFTHPISPIRSKSCVRRNLCTRFSMTAASSDVDVAKNSSPNLSAPARLRALLASDGILTMPCCYDALTARLVERAGFPLTFMSGYSVAGSFGLPDTGLLCASEMADVLRRITTATSIPVLADADTGFGNAINVKRTLRTYFDAGAAGVLIEDQVIPKRCGHTRGKQVVSYEDAITRVRAACDARDEYASNEEDRPVIFARTDAARDDFEEALRRARGFLETGADATFVEAPRTKEQMQRYCDEVGGWKLANMLEMGETPVIPPEELQEMGYKVAAYPLTLLSAAVKAQEEALRKLKAGEKSDDVIKTFDELCDIVGFNDYYAEEKRYSKNK